MDSDVKKLELLMQKGQGQKVREYLDQLNLKKVPRSLLVAFSQIARRAGRPESSLRLLRDIVYPKIEISPAANDGEITTYAAALASLGAVDESLELFNKVNFKEFPEGYYLKGLSLIRQWRYREAIPLFKKYLKSANFNEFKKTVVLLNLAACYGFTEDDEGFYKVFHEGMGLAEKQMLENIQGSFLEVQAQYLIHQKEYRIAIDLLSIAEKSFKNKESRYFLFIQKWLILSRFLLDPKQATHRTDLMDLRKYFQQNKIYESVRNCDHYQALGEKSSSLLEKLYYGTPFAPYKNKIHNDYKDLFGTNITSKFYSWQISHSSESEPIKLDLTGSRFTRDITSNTLNLKILKVLTSDFYRPFTVPRLFSEVYSGEYFDPDNSPQRLYQSIYRLNQTLKDKNYPLSIKSKDSSFILYSEQPFIIKVPKTFKISKKEDTYLALLKRNFQHRAFSSSEAAKTLEIQKSTAIKIIKEGVKSKALTQTGSGRSTKYFFK